MIDNQEQTIVAPDEPPEGQQNALIPAVQETALIKYHTACRALSEACAVDEVKGILDQALKLKYYAKLAGNKELERDAVAIRVRAERRLGEMMAAQGETVGKAKPLSGKGQRKTDRRVLPQPDGAPSLAEAGIDKNLAHRARTLAKLPVEEFEKRVAEVLSGTRDGLDIRRRGKPAKRTDAQPDGADGRPGDDAHKVAEPNCRPSSFPARADQVSDGAHAHQAAHGESGKSLTVSFTDSESSQVIAVAERLGIPADEVVHRAVAEFVAKHPPQNPAI